MEETTKIKTMPKFALFVAALTVVFIFLALAKLFNISIPLDVTMNSKIATADSQFSVTGVGEVEVVPDVAVVNAGIRVSRAATAEEARERISVVNNAIIEAVKKLKVDSSDIETSQFSVNPEYSYNDTTPIRPLDLGTSVGAEPAIAIDESQPGGSRIVGYNGDASVTIKVRDQEIVSKVLTAVTAAGANQVGDVNYIVDKVEDHQDEARIKAIKDAKKRATKISGQTGLNLGRIVNVIDNSYNPYPYRSYDTYALSAEMDKAGPTAPVIEPGTDKIRVNVTLVYELK